MERLTEWQLDGSEGGNTSRLYTRAPPPRTTAQQHNGTPHGQQQLSNMPGHRHRHHSRSRSRSPSRSRSNSPRHGHGRRHHHTVGAHLGDLEPSSDGHNLDRRKARHKHGGKHGGKHRHDKDGKHKHKHKHKHGKRAQKFIDDQEAMIHSGGAEPPTSLDTSDEKAAAKDEDNSDHED